MKAEDVKVGATYHVKLHGKPTKVMVKRIEVKPGWEGINKIYPQRTHYVCTNLTTGREVTIKSAAKFRSEVETKPKREGEQRVDPFSSIRVATTSRGGSGVNPDAQSKNSRTGGDQSQDAKEGEQRSDPTTVMKTNGTMLPGGGPIGFGTTGSSEQPTSSPSASPPGDSCSWEPRNEYGFPRFKINGKVYDFQFTPFGVELSYLDEQMSMVTWKVTCNRAGVPVQCNCPSDGNGTMMVHCKHVRALRAALSKAPYSLI